MSLAPVGRPEWGFNHAASTTPLQPCRFNHALGPPAASAITKLPFGFEPGCEEPEATITGFTDLESGVENNVTVEGVLCRRTVDGFRVAVRGGGLLRSSFLARQPAHPLVHPP